MLKNINWANLVTISRVLLAFVTYAILLMDSPNSKTIYLCFILTITVIAGDYLDGQLARAFKQSSPLGAWLDIAADRLVEICYWIVFACLHWVSPWIGIIFVSRGLLVDGIRSFANAAGYTAFGEKTMMESMLGKFLVSSSFSRVFYAFCKAAAFGLVILSQVHSTLQFWAMLFVYLATFFCIARGLPVIIEGGRFLKTKNTK